MARKGQRTITRSPRPGCPAPVSASAQTGTFRQEGEYWALGIGGKVFRLKDTKGLAYLAHLLRYPTTEFHVLDLAAGISDSGDEGDTDRLPRSGEDLQKAGIHVGRLGDAGEVVDDQAKRAYRRRLAELRQELDEAKELGEIDRAEQLEDEIDALNKELSRAVGLGGRNRRSASASERARQSITKTVKTTLAKIAQVDSTIGAILTRDIQNGHLLFLST